MVFCDFIIGMYCLWFMFCNVGLGFGMFWGGGGKLSMRRRWMRSELCGVGIGIEVWGCFLWWVSIDFDVDE